MLPKVLEQLLRRSKMLAEAQRAAEAGDAETLRRYAWAFDILGAGLVGPAIGRRGGGVSVPSISE